MRIVSRSWAGPRRLLVMMPPRHGKSQYLDVYVPAWYLGTFPDRKVILASYEAQFAESWGAKARDVLIREGHRFGVAVNPLTAGASRWEISEHDGGMLTAGVGGPITGKGADLLIIDDPIKNAEESRSEIYRNRTWEWYTSTAFTRLEPGGILVLIMTRWHKEDLAGRLLAAERDKWIVVNFPAISTGPDSIGRAAGDALWPERYPADRLAEIKASIGTRWFSSLYQQEPVASEAALLRRHWFRVVKETPKHLRMVRYWDLGGAVPKQGTDPDWSRGALLGLDTRTGQWYIVDMRSLRGTPKDVQDLVAQTHALNRGIPVRMEQEPGSSGINVIDHYARMVLPGADFRGVKPSGDKVLRAGPLSAAAEAGNVFLVEADWNKSFLDEVESFPTGRHDDQVDAVSGAMAVLSERIPLAVAFG